MKIIDKYQDELEYRFGSLIYFARNNYTKNLLSKLSFKDLFENENEILVHFKQKALRLSLESVYNLRG